MPRNQVEFEIKGFDELARKLRRLSSTKAKAIFRTAMREAAKTVVLPAAQRAVPFDTGNLLNAIEIKAIKRSRKRQGVNVRIRERSRMLLPITGSGYYPTHIEWGTKKMKAQPFLRPAAEDNRSFAIGVASARIRAGINQLVR